MSVQSLSHGVWAFEENGVRSFLILGTNRALLLDTGWGTYDLQSEIKKLTSLPITLVLTHSDIDHIGLNEHFKADAWAHPAEFLSLAKKTPGITYHRAEDGQVFDLGGRSLKVIHCPGHTPGSIALLDEANGILFPGDIVSEATIFMFGEGRDFNEFIASQKRFKQLKNTVKTIYPCHGPCPIEPDGIYDELAELAARVIAGEKVTEVEHMVFPDEEFDVFIHRNGRASMYTF